MSSLSTTSVSAAIPAAPTAAAAAACVCTTAADAPSAPVSKVVAQSCQGCLIANGKNSDNEDQYKCNCEGCCGGDCDDSTAMFEAYFETIQTRAIQERESGGRDSVDPSLFGNEVLWITYNDELRSTPGLLRALCHDFLMRPDVRTQTRAVVVELWQQQQADDTSSSSEGEGNDKTVAMESSARRNPFRDLQAIGQALGKLQSLELLKFKRIFEDSFTVDLRWRSALISHMPQISALEDCPVGAHIGAYAAALNGHPALKRVTFHGLPEDTPDHALEEAVLSLPQLQEFACFFFTFLRPQFFAKLIAAKNKLHRFCLNGDALTQETWEIVCDALAVAAVETPSSSSAALTEVNPPATLKSLHLSFYRPPPNFAHTLALALQTNTSLESIMFQPCSAFAAVVLNEAGEFLGTSLAQHPNLKEMDLRMPNRVSPQEAMQWVALLQSLSSKSPANSTRGWRKVSFTRFPWSLRDMAQALYSFLNDESHSIEDLEILSLRCTTEWNGLVNALFAENQCCRLRSLTINSAELRNSNVTECQTMIQHQFSTWLRHQHQTQQQQHSNTLQQVKLILPKLSCPLSAVSAVLDSLSFTSSNNSTDSNDGDRRSNNHHNCSEEKQSTLNSLCLQLGTVTPDNEVDDILAFRELIRAVSSNYHFVAYKQQDCSAAALTSTTTAQEEASHTTTLSLIPHTLPTSRHEAVVTGILTMNEAGRSYIKTDPTNHHKGIRVLSSVIDNLDCIFLHLLENPFLCS